MTSEITNQDRSRGGPKQTERIPYGVGTHAKLKYDSGDGVYTLTGYAAGFFHAINPMGWMTHLSVESIDKLLIDGHWMNFDGNPRRWKKIF